MLSSILLISFSMWLISFGPLGSPLLNKVLLLISIYIIGAYFIAQFNFYFVSLSYIIVYIGAIAILFIFIIMIWGGGYVPTDAGLRGGGLRFSPVLFFMVLLLPSSSSTLGTFTQVNWLTHYFPTLDIQNFSLVLFNGWPIIIVLIGILLTSCLIGILETVGGSSN